MRTHCWCDARNLSNNELFLITTRYDRDKNICSIGEWICGKTLGQNIDFITWHVCNGFHSLGDSGWQLGFVVTLFEGISGSIGSDGREHSLPHKLSTMNSRRTVQECNVMSANVAPVYCVASFIQAYRECIKNQFFSNSWINTIQPT